MVFEVFGYTQETEIVATIEDFVGVLCLFGRKSAVEIIINSCQCLGLIHVEFDGIEQQVAIPTFRTCLLCVEKPLLHHHHQLSEEVAIYDPKAKVRQLVALLLRTAQLDVLPSC